MKKEIQGNSVIKIRIGKTRLLLPAKELFTIVTDVQSNKEGMLNMTAATINIDDLEIPVYTSDEELHFIPYHAGDWPCCLCLDDGNHRFGIMCDEASLAESTGFTHYDLPQCMKCDHSPVHGLTVNNSTVFCITDTKSLFKLIE